jgi:hypothetical protein
MKTKNIKTKIIEESGIFSHFCNDFLLTQLNTKILISVSAFQSLEMYCVS